MKRLQRLEQDGWNSIEPIEFFAAYDPWGGFSNFSDHTIVLIDPWTNEPFEYQTGEHRYQAMKADNQDDHDYVVEVNNPGGAQRRGRQVSLRDGWGQRIYQLGWYVMLELIIAKCVQHEDIQRLLSATDGRLIYEDSPTDDIWGWRHGPDYRGSNLLGQCWMQTRTLLFR